MILLKAAFYEKHRRMQCSACDGAWAGLLLQVRQSDGVTKRSLIAALHKRVTPVPHGVGVSLSPK